MTASIEVTRPKGMFAYAVIATQHDNLTQTIPVVSGGETAFTPPSGSCSTAQGPGLACP